MRGIQKAQRGQGKRDLAPAHTLINTLASSMSADRGCRTCVQQAAYEVPVAEEYSRRTRYGCSGHT